LEAVLVNTLAHKTTHTHTHTHARRHTHTHAIKTNEETHTKWEKCANTCEAAAKTSIEFTTGRHAALDSTAF
jgi:hypothetical protein